MEKRFSFVNIKKFYARITLDIIFRLNVPIDTLFFLFNIVYFWFINKLGWKNVILGY